MMLELFPVLEHLQISLEYGIAPVLLGVFLGRNTFSGILYLVFSIYHYLLLSACSLVELKLPPTGCIAPEVRAASVTALHQLKKFSIPALIE